MNNNKIKILSVITLVLFAGLFAMPFFTHISCDMVECGVPYNTCNMNMVVDNCCGTMTECTLVPYQPVTSSPLLKVNVEKDLTVDYLTSVEIIPSFQETVLTPLYQLKILISEVHPGFQTPLLV